MYDPRPDKTGEEKMSVTYCMYSLSVFETRTILYCIKLIRNPPEMNEKRKEERASLRVRPQNFASRGSEGPKAPKLV
jgi:hypothetical protein